MELKPVTMPVYLKIGFFGHTGTGKTWTAVQLLSQFIRDYVPDSQLAIFDTEGGAGYLKAMVKGITGKELVAIASHSFSELLEFADECRGKHYVALLDSATHPWRSLCKDYLDAKRSRVKNAGGNVENTRLTLPDWGPLKEMWARFADKYRYDPVHWCICGREGDVWDDVTDDEGTTKATKTGVKMKTETEMGYEPSFLIRMTISTNKQGAAEHTAFVMKDRFGVLTGNSAVDPDITFFKPHLDLLDLKGNIAAPNSDAKPAFKAGAGPNWETIRKRREAVLEEIKNDLLLAYPGMDKDSKTGKVKALRHVFQTSSWTKLEEDTHLFSLEKLEKGRTALYEHLQIPERKTDVKDSR